MKLVKQKIDPNSLPSTNEDLEFLICVLGDLPWSEEPKNAFDVACSRILAYRDVVLKEAAEYVSSDLSRDEVYDLIQDENDL